MAPSAVGLALLLSLSAGAVATKTVFMVPHAHCDWGWLRTPLEYFDYEVRQAVPDS
jgi:hypothetical protein